MSEKFQSPFLPQHVLINPQWTTVNSGKLFVPHLLEKSAIGQSEDT